MELNELEVKVISREVVKPSSPTPSHLRNFSLSLLDQLFPSYYIPIFLFYPPTPNNANFEVSGPHLKSSLSKTLSQFYPLAGRFKDDSTLICNDEGVLFIEAHVHFRLSTLLLSSKASNRKWLHKFLPPREILPTGAQPISQAFQLAFQHNVFLDGGVVIGCYLLHKMLDIVSLSIFFRHWAWNNIGIPGPNPIQPDFDVAVSTFPPCLEPPLTHKADNPTHNIMDVKILGRTFVFNNNALSELKTKAISERVPNPTRFEAVSGFIWAHVIKASGSYDRAESTLSFPVDIRGRASTSGPKIPKGSMGNLTAQLVVRAHEQAGFQDRVAGIHEGIINATSEIVKEYRKGKEAVIGLYKTLKDEIFRGSTNESKSNVWVLTSWCRVGLDEVDFGFGKPEWIVPIDGRICPGSNSIVLTEYTHPSGDTCCHGIAAWMDLLENTMQNLELDVDFLAFASPQPQW